MAQRRMFSKTITSSSGFLMMPPTSRLLYYDLGMNADDDGYCEHFMITRMTDSSPDDLKVLEARGFIKVFDDKILIIRDWKENNYLRSDRYTPSKYKEIYKIEANYTNGIPDGRQMATQVRLGKVRLGKDIDSIPAHEVQVTPYKRISMEKATLVQRLVYHLEDTLHTSIVNWGKQGKAVSSMIRAGYTEEQIKKTITYMATKDDFFIDKGFDLTTVSSQISRYKAESNKNGLH